MYLARHGQRGFDPLDGPHDLELKVLNMQILHQICSPLPLSKGTFIPLSGPCSPRMYVYLANSDIPLAFAVEKTWLEIRIIDMMETTFITAVQIPKDMAQWQLKVGMYDRCETIIYGKLQLLFSRKSVLL